MLLRPRKHPRSADEPVSPADIAESLLAMGMMAWIIAPAPFLWAPPIWVLALMSPVERSTKAAASSPTRAQIAPPAREERVVAALAPPRPEPPVATPVQASPPAMPRAARTSRTRPRPRRTEPRS